MNDLKNIAKNLNILGAFCGKRDVSELTAEQLSEKYGFQQADVMGSFWWKHSVWRRCFSKSNAESHRKEIRHCRRSRTYDRNTENTNA